MQSGHLDQAILLAPGAPLVGASGRRLVPAPLASVGGLTLLKRALQTAARRAGVRRFVVVTDDVAALEAAVAGDAELADLQIRFVYAAAGAEGAGLLAAEALVEGEFFLVGAEVVLDPAIYRRLHAEPARDGVVLAVDHRPEARAEAGAVAVRLSGERARSLGGAPGVADAVATGVMRAGPGLFTALRAVAERGEGLSLAAAVDQLGGAGRARVVDVGAAWWCAVRSVEAGRHAQKLLFKSLTKAIDGPVSKAINRRFSKRVTRLLMNTPVVPNHMTALGLVVGLAAALVTAFVTPATLWMIPLGGVLYQLSSMLDGVDGEIARLKFKHSDWGEWFDTVSDDVINLSYQLSIGVAAWRLTGSSLWWQVGLASFVLGWVVCLSLYRKLIASGKGTHLAIEWSFNDTQAPRSLFQKFCARLMFVGKRDFYALVLMLLSFVGLAGLQWVLVLSLITVSIIAVQWAITAGQQGGRAAGAGQSSLGGQPNLGASK